VPESTPTTQSGESAAESLAPALRTAVAKLDALVALWSDLAAVLPEANAERRFARSYADRLQDMLSEARAFYGVEE
jgi:hypothetical protein